MSDLHDLLERAGRRAPAPTTGLSELTRIRDRRRRARKLEAGVVGMMLAVAAFGVAFFALREHRGFEPATDGTTEILPPATQPPLVAGPDQYYYERIHLVGDFSGDLSVASDGVQVEGAVDLAAEFWWRPDESGRIAVTKRDSYGIDEGIFGPGEFPNPNGIDVSSFPTDPAELTSFLLARSQDDGSSPAPLVTPPPDGAPQDGRMWRAITDLLQNPQVTPTVRAALIDVAAGLQGSHVELGDTDPGGRPADVISFGNWGGELIERLYVDPSSHELLAITWTSQGAVTPLQTWLVEAVGLADSTDGAPETVPIAPARTRAAELRN